MYRNVLMDLDDTILDFGKAEAAAAALTLRELGLDGSAAVCARYSAINLAQWKRLEIGELTVEQLKPLRFRLLFEELGAAASPEEAAACYEEHLAEGHAFVEGAEELLRTLYGRRRLYLVSNGTRRVQRQRLRDAGIGGYFEGVFLSEELGASKPSAAFFERCAAQIPGYRAAETILLGDSLSSDVQGGRNAGVTTVWLNPTGAENRTGPQPDFEIRSLREFLPLLQALE